MARTAENGGHGGKGTSKISRVESVNASGSDDDGDGDVVQNETNELRTKPNVLNESHCTAILWICVGNFVARSTYCEKEKASKIMKRGAATGGHGPIDAAQKAQIKGKGNMDRNRKRRRNQTIEARRRRT